MNIGLSFIEHSRHELVYLAVNVKDLVVLMMLNSLTKSGESGRVTFKEAGIEIKTNVNHASCTALYCTSLYTALHCTTLYCAALHCTSLYCTALYLAVPYWWIGGYVGTAASRRLENKRSYRYNIPTAQYPIPRGPHEWHSRLSFIMALTIHSDWMCSKLNFVVPSFRAGAAFSPTWTDSLPQRGNSRAEHQ